MRDTAAVLLIAFVFFVFAGCEDKDKNDTGIYQMSYIEDSFEYVEVTVNGKIKKFVVRDKDTEYAAIPDFLQKGDEIGFEYRYDKEIGENIITRFFTPND